MSSVFGRSGELERSTELKDLALFFFKQGGCTANEAYDHAHSFLSISKNKYGQDIIDVVVKYDLVIEHAPESSNGAAKYFLYYVDEETGGKPAVITLIGDYVTSEKAINAVNDFILENMIPEKLTQDGSKVLKVRLVQDSDVRQLCKGVFVEKSMIICD